MGKLVIDIPSVSNLKIKANNLSEAIKKLADLKSNSEKWDKVIPIQRFKGIAKYKINKNIEEEWYLQ